MQPEGGECAAKNAAAAEAGKKKTDAPKKLAKIFKTEFDAKYNIVDTATPLNAFMSGQYKRSNAYYSIRNDLPVVLTKVIDSITKDKNELVAQFGENAREELKILIGLISRLKYELQTDKAFQEFTGEEPDREMWNSFIKHLPEDARTFYRACWLHTESYMYRKLYSFVENSIFLREFDYFGKIKEHSLDRCQAEILTLSKYTRRIENSVEIFGELLKYSLWSNRDELCEDLESHQFNTKLLDDVLAKDKCILVNNISEIWCCLCDNNKANTQHIDFVLDNAGYELFTDLILAEYIIENGLADKVRFHVKAHPWFVHNITAKDFNWTLQYLSNHADYIISLIGQKYVQFLEEGKFELAHTSHFWTAPQACHDMRIVDPELYRTLQESKLIIFKGDLSYRRLLGDVCWEPTQDMRTCLGGFLPSNLCSLHTIKSEVICGLSGGVIQCLTKQDPNWMVNGNYGIVQFVDGSRQFGY